MARSVSKEIYLNEALKQAPRLLGLLDRNILSKSYGCFDRNYWHYSTIDFANARRQEAVLFLALLYNTKHRRNFYYRKEKLLEFINAALGFWLGIQHGNGSFSEWYPNENSFVATAFSGYALSETLLEIKKGIRNREEIIHGLENATDFAAKHSEKRAQNQETGSIAFLYNMFLLTGKKKYRAVARKKLRLLLKRQSKEGWFEEYNGFDVGYHSLAIDYLAKYYMKSGDKLLPKPLEKAVNFLCFFVQPDNSFGGHYCSRNTEYVIPHGLELLSKKFPKAKVLANQVRKSIAGHELVSLASLDDNYLCYNGYTYLQAFRDANAKLQAQGDFSFEEKFERMFNDSGLFIKSSAEYYLIVNAFKGGAFKLCSRTSTIDDPGLLVETISGKKLFSSAFSKTNSFKLGNNCFKVEGSLAFVPERILSPAKNILLRSYQLSAGRHPKISAATKEVLRNKLITKQKFSRIMFCREIFFAGNKVTVTDSAWQPEQLKKIFLGHAGAHIQVPSSNYFFPEKINYKHWQFSGHEIRKRTKDNVFSLKRTFH